MNASQNHAATMRPVRPAAADQHREGHGIAQRDQDRPRDLVPRDPGEAVREHHRHEGELRIHPRFGDADDGSTLDRPPSTTVRRRGRHRPSADWAGRTPGRRRGRARRRTRSTAPPASTPVDSRARRFRGGCRPGRGSASSRASATARGSAAATSSAVIGPPSAPRSPAARLAARPCSHTPVAARGPRSAPDAAPATTAPIAPASTSPVPAVASHGVPADDRGRPAARRRDDRDGSLQDDRRAERRRRLDRGCRPLGIRRRRALCQAEVRSQARVLPIVRRDDARCRRVDARSSAPASTTTGSADARMPRSAAVSASDRLAASVPDPISHACTRPSAVTVSGRRCRTSEVGTGGPR